jgi:hypothetical protein
MGFANSFYIMVKILASGLFKAVVLKTCVQILVTSLSDVTNEIFGWYFYMPLNTLTLIWLHIYLTFIANNILYCIIFKMAEQLCSRERESLAEINIADILRSYVGWHLQGCRRQVSGIAGQLYVNLMTGSSSLNHPRSYQTNERLISDITIVWLGIIALQCLFLRCY